MNCMKVFVYFVENEIVEGVLASWPPGMKLAMVLHKSGKCELIVFHRNETRRLIEKMSSVLGLPHGSFGIVPAIQGYPTKTIRFSEQQQLLSLIVNKDDLCERASDYAINYRFAEEEGLDPIHFTSLDQKAQNPSIKPKIKDSFLVKPFETRRLKPQEPLHFSRSVKRKQEKDKMKKPYAGSCETFSEVARLEKHGPYIRLVLNPDTAAKGLKVLRAAEVRRREEFGQFELARALLGKWKLGGSAIIEIPADKLPADLSADYFDQPHIAAVLISPGGVFVTSGSEIPSLDQASDYVMPMNYPFHKAAKRGQTFANNQKEF